MKKLKLDECHDSNGHYTIRVDDGTPNGDTSIQPIATVYDLDVAKLMVRRFNFVENQLYGA